MVKLAVRKWVPTARNLEVLAAVCATGSRKDAAIELGISHRTVETHMKLLRVGSHATSDANLCWRYRDQIAAHVEPE